MASKTNSERPCSLFLFAVLLAVGVCTSSVALAAPTAAEKETARRLMDEGKARLKANDPQHAIEAFQKAHDIMHVPTTGIALARAQLAAGHLVEARDNALEIQRLPRDPGEPAVFETARKQARELDGQLRPRIPTLRIRIHGGPATRVAVDDFELASSIVGEPVAVNPGKRVVTARSADGSEVKGEIELAEREVREIELTLPGRGETAKSGGASASNAGSSSSPSNASTGTTPSKPDAHVGPGGDGGGDGAGMHRTQVAEGLMYGGAIAGGVGIAAGIVTGALTLSKAHGVTPQCDNDICAPAAKGDLDSALTFGTISTIAFIVGIAGCGAAVIGYFLPKKPEATDASPRPRTVILGPQGIGGTF